MTAKELRQKYLDFFRSKGHAIIPSASLIPENDPSVLFTTAGMHPLIPYLMGEKHPEGKRLANVQKCLRTGDIEEVGDATHHTFFEMLGNWSLGDYFKKEAIEWSWEFLTDSQWLGLDKNRIAISVFQGDENAPADEEAFKFWKNLGIPEERVTRLPKEDNWWGMETGPCGPDTEMFYWVGDPKRIPKDFRADDKQWVEIWNDVFMQYNRTKSGNYEPLEKQSVDTGMGLERTLAILNDLDDNYQTELFLPIIKKLEEISGIKYSQKKPNFRIIADHLKAATMIIGDEKGIVPSNVDQGYVVRKLIRRAIRHGKTLGINHNFTSEISATVIGIYQETYAEIRRNEKRILEIVEGEENKFRQTLENGLREFEKISHSDISGREAFNLYQTYGFPLEITQELARERNIQVDEKNFALELKKHQDLSRTASAGKFKGGLADSSSATRKLHTAAHLMLEALRRVLGEQVFQKGSNITPERLRFDFSHSEKMTPDQIKRVEALVNEQIQKNLPVSCEEMTLEEAKNSEAMGVFESKYGEKVKVYSAGDFSREICGGPHVEKTGELGKFRIVKEESSSAGVRRIKAVLV